LAHVLSGEPVATSPGHALAHVLSGEPVATSPGHALALIPAERPSGSLPFLSSLRPIAGQCAVAGRGPRRIS